MEARLLRLAALAAAFFGLGASFKTANFVVEAPTQQVAEQVGRAAEKYRHELAIHWLGQALPANWSKPCPIHVQVGDQLGAGGATSFLFDHGEVYGWKMNIQGSLERVIDSVLPHEVSHTIFATHFRQPLPRWADEGACTTVEHKSERAKQQEMLIHFLKNGRGIPFSRMFAMKEYPDDVMPLYSQGYSLTTFLIQHGGRKKFLSFVEEGLKDEQWMAVTEKQYGFPTLAALQDAWLDWVRAGSPNPPGVEPAPDAVAYLSSGAGQSRPEPNLIYRGQSADPPAAGSLVRVRPAAGRAPGRAASATTSGDTATPSTDAGDRWQPAENRPAAPRAMAATAASHASAERTGHVILEWSRESDSSAVAGGDDAAEPADAEPADGVSEARNPDASVYVR